MAEGDGRYEALQGVGAVVGVVGTAHVRGIIRAWPAAQADFADVERFVAPQE